MNTDHQPELLSEFAEALPFQFDFYHLGNVSQLKHIPKELTNNIVGIQIYGDYQALFLLFLEDEVDIAIYLELGNVLASKMITQITSNLEIDVLISPPFRLNPNRLSLLNFDHTQVIRKTFIHSYAEKLISIESWLIPVSFHEGVGNA